MRRAPNAGDRARRLFVGWGSILLVTLAVAGCSPFDRGSTDTPDELASDPRFVIVTVTTALSPTPRVSESTYEVQEGDTLSGIADMFGVSWDAIIEANNLQSQDAIFVGQVLVIPLAATPEA